MRKYIAIAILFALLLGCSGEEKEQETIDIGAMLIMTGPGSSWGQMSRQALDLAVKEVNSEGGVLGKKVNIIYEDTRGYEPKTAVTAYEKLSAQGVDKFIGTTWSPSGKALAPRACEDKILGISPTLGVADYNEACDYLFNLWTHDEILSEELGNYLYEKGYRNIAILGTLQVWEQLQAKAVKKGFEKAGGEISIFELVPNEEKDFRAEALKIHDSDAEAIVFTNQPTQHLSAKRLRDVGSELPFYSVVLDDVRIEGAEGAFENAITITSFTPRKNFIEKFEEEYGETPRIGSDTAYDSFMLLVEAMEKTKSTDASVLKDYINSLETYEGESGSLTFDGKGGVTKNLKYQVVKDDKLVDLK